VTVETGGTGTREGGGGGGAAEEEPIKFNLPTSLESCSDGGGRDS